MPKNPFSDALGPYADRSPKLESIVHKRRSNLSEMQVLAQISQLIGCLEVTTFTACLREWLEKTYMGNSIRMEMAYKVVVNEDCTEAEVWHTNVQGDPDRHLCTVKQKGVTP